MTLLCTEEYRNQLSQYHQKDATWGNGPRRYIPVVGHFIYENQVTNVLDYGCGKGKNLSWIFGGITWVNYDPGIEQWASDPATCPHLICMDVLEHIEPELLDNVLEHINSKFTKRALLSISCSPSRHELPDGRNAHLIIENHIWWLQKLEKVFTLEKVYYLRGDSFVVVVAPGRKG